MKSAGDIQNIREALSDPTIASYPDFTAAVGEALTELEHLRSIVTIKPVSTDWGQKAFDTATAILLYLGIGSEASAEPGIDRHRDYLCRLIEDVREEVLHQ